MTQWNFLYSLVAMIEENGTVHEIALPAAHYERLEFYYIDMQHTTFAVHRHRGLRSLIGEWNYAAVVEWLQRFEHNLHRKKGISEYAQLDIMLRIPKPQFGKETLKTTSSLRPDEAFFFFLFWT